MTISRLKNENGVSLLEVLVAMMILSFSLMMLLNMAMIALDGNDWSNKTTLSTQLLQEKLEQIRATASFGNGSDTANGVIRTWNVSYAGPHLRQVDVSVVWLDMQAQERTNAITAYVRSDSV
jgi:prepilin-type N-terminal cleavage/methylation domain-containing protein